MTLGEKTQYFNMETLFDFDDIQLVPAAVTKISTRAEINPHVNGFLPIITAPMDTVVCPENRHLFIEQCILTTTVREQTFTLKKEYDRDIAAKKPIHVPVNYYPDDDPTQKPIDRWRGHANLLFANWINYYVYQETPFDLDQLTSES